MTSEQKVVREHDKLYLSENRKLQPKEYFKFIARKAEPHLQNDFDFNLLDIGCATGDFLYYLKSLYPDAQCFGLEVMPELIARAKEEVSNCSFLQGNICDANTLPQQKFDVVFMNGVHSIFNNVDDWLANAISLVKKPEGKLYIFGIFNPDEVDVLLQVRSTAGDNESAVWQSGWNCFSIKTFENALNKLKVKSFDFSDFNIEIDIPKHESDPLRSWTFTYDNGSRGVVNGTMLLHHFMLLEIQI